MRGTSHGYLFALNADTGTLVWAVKAADTKQGETLTMAPLLFDDLVLIGPAGSENAIPGWVGAFRLRDGSPVWKFQTVPGATLAGSESWKNPKGIKLGGGSLHRCSDCYRVERTSSRAGIPPLWTSAFTAHQSCPSTDNRESMRSTSRTSRYRSGALPRTPLGP